VRFAFFEAMSSEEAERFLEEFLRTEREALPPMIVAAQAENVACDFRLSSIRPFYGWILGQLRTHPRAEDASLPEWIRLTPSYKGGLFDFDELSRNLILRSAYYLGESFVRSSARLRWAAGRADTAVQRQPVVTGFDSSLEMAPILVSENLFRRIVADGATLAAVDQAVATWGRDIPQGS